MRGLVGILSVLNYGSAGCVVTRNNSYHRPVVSLSHATKSLCVLNCPYGRSLTHLNLYLGRKPDYCVGFVNADKLGLVNANKLVL